LVLFRLSEAGRERVTIDQELTALLAVLAAVLKANQRRLLVVPVQRVKATTAAVMSPWIRQLSGLVAVVAVPVKQEQTQQPEAWQVKAVTV
jgi:hypothetical protein